MPVRPARAFSAVLPSAQSQVSQRGQLAASAGLSRVRGTYTGTSKEFIMTDPGHGLLR
jgi:hypothetical protein